MNKLNKMTLKKADVNPLDIVKKKQMKDVLGGKGCCTWECTIDKDGNVSESGEGSSYNDCWSQAESKCNSYDGIRIINFC